MQIERELQTRPLCSYDNARAHQLHDDDYCDDDYDDDDYNDDYYDDDDDYDIYIIWNLCSSMKVKCNAMGGCKLYQLQKVNIW